MNVATQDRISYRHESTSQERGNWSSLNRQSTIRNKFRTGSVATSQSEGGILIGDCGVAKKKSEILVPQSEISFAGRYAPSSGFVLTNRVAFRQSSRTAKSETEPVRERGTKSRAPTRVFPALPVSRFISCVDAIDSAVKNYDHAFA